MNGLFITMEGPEGGGKSTQVARLSAFLRAAGHDVLCAREPGGTPTGDAIRDIVQHNGAGEPVAARAETLLFAASRAQLVNRVIAPALAAGRVVLCDRFADSTTAYQGYGRGFDIARIIEINAFAVDGVRPDLTLLLDLDVSLGFERLAGRHAARDRIENEAMAFHERVRAGYREMAAREPDRFRVIDASAGMDPVFDQVRAATMALFQARGWTGPDRAEGRRS